VWDMVLLHSKLLFFKFTCVSLQARAEPTSSPAVAERPRNAASLSAVSFNSTISRAQSSVISYFRFIFTADSALFVVVIHAGCDKQ